MNKVERRTTAAGQVKLEKRADGKPRAIAGTGAVFYSEGDPGTEYVLWDFGGEGGERAVERLMPGAFDQAMARPDDVRGLFNHDSNQVLGRTKAGTMRLSTDAKALSYEIDPGDTSVARDVAAHLERGDVSGSSIAFVVDEERWTETKDADGKWNVLREILSVTLYDVGPVTFPAYESTTAGLRKAADAGGVEEAKRSLAEFRKKQQGGEENSSLDGLIAAYRARARVVEVQEREAA